MQSRGKSLTEAPRSVKGWRGKKERSLGSVSISTRKRRCQSEQFSNKCADPDTPVNGQFQSLLPAPDTSVSGKFQAPLPGQLPAPVPTIRGHQAEQGPVDPSVGFISNKNIRLPDVFYPPLKRTCLLSQSLPTFPAIEQWLADLPQTYEIEPSRSPDIPDDMSQAPRKPPVAYHDSDYEEVMAAKGSHTRDSEQRLVAEDEELCNKLLTTEQEIPPDDRFDDKKVAAFLKSLESCSEARLITQLHPLIMPTVQNRHTYGDDKFKAFSEGGNDAWTKSLPFYGPQPQPDHTYGFNRSNFSADQCRKLGIDSKARSHYTARDNILFVFLTGEVKTEKQGLLIAERQNQHSMTVAQCGIIDLYRRANRAEDVHRRVLGFSISHNVNSITIYAHYPEINGDEITYWRQCLRSINFKEAKGLEERWTSYRFVLNVCELFALPLLERLKGLIDELPDPDTSTVEFQDKSTVRTRTRQSARIKNRNATEILEQVYKDGKEDKMFFQAQFEKRQEEARESNMRWEQERKDGKEDRMFLQAQLEKCQAYRDRRSLESRVRQKQERKEHKRLTRRIMKLEKEKEALRQAQLEKKSSK